MLDVKFYDEIDDKLLKFAVIIAKYNNKWVFCKHKDRDTYECPGGHRDMGEDIFATAKRELYEETGAVEYILEQICAYSVSEAGSNREETFGMLYFCDILKFDALPSNFEMEKIEFFEVSPPSWTYPEIQPKLLEYVNSKCQKTIILYGTGNEAKLAAMRACLKPLPITLLGLKDMNTEIPIVDETGKNPLENARLKANAYYKAFQIPVFSCDSGLYFDNVPDDIQPGVHVRTVNDKILTDEEMITHYSVLAKKYGDLASIYQNAICFVKDSRHIYESMDENLSGDKFIITAIPHQNRIKGFPLDSLSKHISSGQYWYDMKNLDTNNTTLYDGFRDFLKNVL